MKIDTVEYRDKFLVLFFKIQVLAIKITDECINCDACVAECPNNAIYEPDQEWSYSDETILKGLITLPKRVSGRCRHTKRTWVRRILLYSNR